MNILEYIQPVQTEEDQKMFKKAEENACDEMVKVKASY